MCTPVLCSLAPGPTHPSDHPQAPHTPLLTHRPRTPLCSPTGPTHPSTHPQAPHTPEEGNLLRQLLFILARPARILECLEAGPADEDAGRALQLEALKREIPTYILRRLTAHFGVHQQARVRVPGCLRGRGTCAGAYVLAWCTWEDRGGGWTGS